MSRLTPVLRAGLAAALFAATAALADPMWIDVRSPEEYAEGHIAGDPHVPGEWETKKDDARDWALAKASRIFKEHQPEPLDLKISTEMEKFIKSVEK